jgi:hypothetical protein
MGGLPSTGSIIIAKPASILLRRSPKCQPSDGELAAAIDTVAPGAECPLESAGPHPDREPQVKKTAKSSKAIRANKRKAKLKAKHRRQRARATT